jgi:small GTP-binding protein
MEREFMEISQMLGNHPIKGEKETYKIGYINVLEYFVKKYSKGELWANSTLKLYVEQLLDKGSQYRYECADIKKRAKPVLASKIKKFKFFSYRYCLVYDCMFINALFDKQKADRMFEELVGIYNRRYEKKIRLLYNSLYCDSENIPQFDKTEYLKKCWEKNIQFLKGKPRRVIITATMSAGKSTMINAIVGKKVNKTQNDSCTAKTHYIFNKPYEDGFSYEWDYALELNADYDTLMDDNENNQGNDIMVGTYFCSEVKSNKRICLIDTPGVNSSQDSIHQRITQSTIEEQKADLMLYVMNGGNMGSEDDMRHLRYVCDNYKGMIIFVINKVDQFRKKEDSVQSTLEKVKTDLKKYGIENPLIVPISSYAAYLAKTKIYSGMLNEDEEDEFERLVKKLNKEEYQFDTYFPEDVRNKVDIKVLDEKYQLLLHSGILHLETIIYSI